MYVNLVFRSEGNIHVAQLYNSFNHRNKTLMGNEVKSNQWSYKDSSSTRGYDWYKFNPYLTNGFSHRYHLGESTFNFRGVRSEFDHLFHFSMKFL